MAMVTGLGANSGGPEFSEGGTVRSFLYWLARLMGDIAAVRKGRVGRRVARRIAGKGTGRLLGRWFK